MREFKVYAKKINNKNIMGRILEGEGRACEGDGNCERGPFSS